MFELFSQLSGSPRNEFFNYILITINYNITMSSFITKFNDADARLVKTCNKVLGL